MIINKEEWSMNDGIKKKKDALVDSKKVEEDIMEMENSLLDGGAAWDIGSTEVVRKRKPAKTECKPKKRRESLRKFDWRGRWLKRFAAR